ncbi:MAG: type II secretion system protein [Phycisphaerae bacterium]|nr:type II secretion system protein [Phycisphaerae bacterium]
MNKRAFTLIELLVVVAILALLVSILLPSLNQAKQLTRRVVCSSNIRNLQLANSIYAGENDGYYVIAAKDIVGANRHRWHGVRDTTNDPFDPARSPLVKYLGAWNKQCPSFRDVFTQSGQSGAGFEAACGGYGYNSQYIGGRNDLYGFGGFCYSAKDDDVKSPACTVVFTDTAFMQSTGDGNRFIEYSFCESPFWHFHGGGPPSNMRPNPTIHFRHLNTTVVVWADGHTDWQQMSFSADYQTHSRVSAEQAAELGIGWFGPDSNELFDLE